MLEEEKATGHPTGRRGNRSSYRKERQQVKVILQKVKATGQGHTTGRKRLRVKVILQEGKVIVETTEKKGNWSSYRKEGNKSY